MVLIFSLIKKVSHHCTFAAICVEFTDRNAAYLFYNTRTQQHYP